MALRGLTIDGVTAGDAEDLGAFLSEVARDEECVRFFFPHPLTREFARDLCSRLLQTRDRYYLWRSHGRVIAYSMLRGWDEGYDVPSFGICVHPELRNLRLGHAILAHAIAESRRAGAHRLRSRVAKENLSAIRLHLKFGFKFTEGVSGDLIGFLDLPRDRTGSPGVYGSPR